MRSRKASWPSAATARRAQAPRARKATTLPASAFSTAISGPPSRSEALSAAAKKYCTQEHKAVSLKKALDAANKLIAELKSKVAALNAELQEYKSVRRQLNTAGLEQENAALKRKLQSYEAEIERNKLWHLFERPKAKPQKEKI